MNPSPLDPALAQPGIDPLLDPGAVHAAVRAALGEDIGPGDATAALVPDSAHARAQVLCREAAVLCGRPWFDEVFAQLDPAVEIEWQAKDGERVAANSIVCMLDGPARALLTGERTALNFLQLLSGTATAARRFADALAGAGAKMLDTRKTIPGLRLAQKYAVRCGGCTNHRIGLFDALLVKENHIAAAGSIAAAVASGRRLHPELTLEVEVESLDELEPAIVAGADIVMLDNFDLDSTREAVRIAAGRARIEFSGSVELDDLCALADTGVDYISSGALTKHVRAIDFSARFTSGARSPQRD